MTKREIEVLWVSNFPPISSAADAGSKTFYYYFNHFAMDPRFHVRLVTCARREEECIIKYELKNIKHKEIYWSTNLVDKLKNFINIESKYNPLNRYGGLISNTDVSKILISLKRWKYSGYKPDVIILEWTNMVVLAPKIHKLFPFARIIASEHDITFIGYKRKAEYYSKGILGIYWKMKYAKEKKVEINALSYCDFVLPQNRDNITVLENEGVSTKMNCIVPFFRNLRDLTWSPQNNDILFFGAMGRTENSLSAIWFINNVMPLLKNTNCRFVVIGSNPPKELLQYKSDRIHITGFVEAIDPFFKKSLCLVAPLVLGAGIKVKVLEGLSAGIPVLTNSIGIEGIPAKKNTDYFFCQTPNDYAEVIRRLVNNNKTNVGTYAKTLINKYFLIDESLEKYKNIVMDIVGGV